MRPFRLLVFVVVSFSCHQSASSLSATQKNDISKEIQQTLAGYYSDIKEEGLLAEFKYLDSSSDFFWVPPGFTSSISFDSVAAILKKNAPLLRSVINSWNTLQIFPISEELATYSGRLHSKIIDTTGKMSETDLIESGVIIKRAGKWKLLCGQTSVLKP